MPIEGRQRRSPRTMFEAKVAEVLNAQLGAWVQDLDAEALKIGVWSGQIVLENLQARATAAARGRSRCTWRARARGAGVFSLRVGCRASRAASSRTPEPRRDVDGEQRGHARPCRRGGLERARFARARRRASSAQGGCLGGAGQVHRNLIYQRLHGAAQVVLPTGRSSEQLGSALALPRVCLTPPDARLRARAGDVPWGCGPRRHAVSRAW